MPPAFVQGNNADNGSSSTTAALAFTANNTAGNLLVCLVRWVNNSGTYTISDSQSNTWVPIYNTTYSGAVQHMTAWYALNCKGGPNTVTVSNVSGAASFIRLAMGEWSGVPTTATVEGPTTIAQGSSTTATTANLTTTGAQDLLIAFGSQITSNLASAPTVSNGFTVRVSGGTGAINDVTIADNVKAPGTYSTTFTYSGSVIWNAGLIAFIAPNPTPPIVTAPSSGPQSVQFFGRLPNGQIAAVAVDTHGNLAISGGSGGATNTVDVLGNGQATPAMLYGATPSGKVVAVAVDANGNLCATIGTGGGNPNTTVDIAAYAVPTPVQVVGREPISGTLYAVPLNASNALYDSVNPGSTPTASLAAPLAKPRKLILCGRTPSGQIVAVALDASGRLCISGSGSSGSVNTVDVYKNGQPLGIQIFGLNASGNLAAVPLDANGNLSLS